jgi:ATP-dependent Lon protease
MARKPAAVETEAGPEEILPVLPLRDIVVFPHMIVPLFVGRAKSIRALEEVMQEEKRILLVAQKNAGDDEPSRETIYDVGTVAQVMQLLKLPDGTVKVLVEGVERARVTDFTDRGEFYESRVSLMPLPKTYSKDTEALSRSTAAQFESYVKLNKKVPQEVLANLGGISDYAKLADTIAAADGGRAPREGLFADGRRDFRVAGREENPQPRQAPDGEDAARILSE